MFLALQKLFEYLLKNKYPLWMLIRIAEEAETSSEFSTEQKKAVKNALRMYKQKYNWVSTSGGRSARRKKARLANSKDLDSAHKNTYISFPMGHGMVHTQRLCRNIIPGATLAPNTCAKNSDKIFTKVKDPLLHSHTFGVVVSWKCSEASCRSGFIAMIRDNNMRHSISSLAEYLPGPWYKHMVDSHSLTPTYPDNIRILSNKGEKNVSALNNRLAIEMAVNPLLICVSGCITNSVGKDIIEAVIDVCK